MADHFPSSLNPATPDFAIHDSIADFLTLLTSKDDLTQELELQKDRLK
ncbi:MAG: hypothetical protein ACFCA4_06620 [Cyanophyceae cyanobacterium]